MSTVPQIDQSASKRESTDWVLRAESISMRYGGHNALSEVSFGVERAMVTGLIGPNGAGKSTLVNVLSGLNPPTGGRIIFEDRPVSGWTLGAAARAGVSRSFQASRVFSEMTVHQNITLGGIHRLTDDESMAILSMLGLGERSRVQASNLSYGELRRLGVGIALASRPQVVLLDEPGAGLTGGDLEALSSAVAQMKSNGTTVLLIDHNMRFIMGAVDTVVVLEGGRLIAEGPPADVQANELVRRAYLGGGDDA